MSPAFPQASTCSDCSSAIALQRSTLRFGFLSVDAKDLVCLDLTVDSHGDSKASCDPGVRSGRAFDCSRTNCTNACLKRSGFITCR